MRKLLSVCIFVSFLCAVSVTPADVFFEGKVYPANNRAYPQVLNPLLKNAKESVYMVMFLASYYPRYPDSPTNSFFKELINARKRGVKIEVILNHSDKDTSSHTTVENLKTARYLSTNNIAVYFAPVDKTTHSKILIIDKKYVLIGSANWSYSAMEKNNEASVIISSPELAEYYIKYFEQIKKESFLFLQPVKNENSDSELKNQPISK